MGLQKRKEELEKELAEINEKLAQEAQEYLVAPLELMRIAKRLNEGWVPDWGNLQQNKCYIYYSHYIKKFNVASIRGSCASWVHFKSEEKAKTAIAMLSEKSKDILARGWA